MKMFRDMLKYRRRLAMGFQVAMAMFAQTKGAAATVVKMPEPKPSSPIDQTSKYDFSKLTALASNPGLLEDDIQPDRRRDLESMVDATWKLASDSQTTAGIYADFVPQPMNREEARLWLQAYNAGPYALLKYQGDVPYRETQNYAPRVFKYYMENLSNTEYDAFIKTSARKYGLDPQFVRAIMKTESDFRNSCVSGAGACGLMQVMPVVWNEVKSKYSLDWDYDSGVFEPQKNIEVACAYLAWLRYDFLPRHFAEFESNPEAPSILVRDIERGVPDRQTPRIETAIAAAQSGPAMQAVGNVAAAAAAVAKVPASQPKVTTKLTKPPPFKTVAAAPAKPARSATKAKGVKPEKITIEVAQASKQKTATHSTKEGKTVVSLRGTGSKTAKAPAMATDKADKAEKTVAKVVKSDTRTFKKPAVAQSSSPRDKGKRS